MLAGVVVAGIYVMPDIVATFAGAHTWELNKSYAAGERVQTLQCGDCHAYIVNEMENAGGGANVFIAHLGAANGTRPGFDGYADYLQLQRNATNKYDMCIMCHTANVTVTGSHTNVIVRSCTSAACHGNVTTAGGYTGMGVAARQVGPRLANLSAEPHSSWFRNLTGDTIGTYVDEYGNRLQKDYYACLGCHTHVGVDFDITRPNKYVLNISRDSGYSVNVTVNATSKNQTTSVGQLGSKWF
jgi:alkylated DNA nucleotide flippase Atl1